MERIGLLGGTFDPVHDGHVQLALAARRELDLENVLLIPAAGPPHKPGVAVTSFHHRREMLVLALAGIEGLEPCFIEGDLPVPSYTIDTIRLLQSGDCCRIEYYFIIGADAFADILSWKEYRQLLSRITLVVAKRKGFSTGKELDKIAAALDYEQMPQVWRSRSGLRDIRFLQTCPPEVSSSQIRQLLAAKCNNVTNVHPAVIRYAQLHRIYVGVTMAG